MLVAQAVAIAKEAVKDTWESVRQTNAGPGVTVKEHERTMKARRRILVLTPMITIRKSILPLVLRITNTCLGRFGVLRRLEHVGSS